MPCLYFWHCVYFGSVYWYLQFFSTTLYGTSCTTISLERNNLILSYSNRRTLLLSSKTKKRRIHSQNKTHCLIQYPQRFSCYSLPWFGMTSRLWLPMLVNFTWLLLYNKHYWVSSLTLPPLYLHYCYTTLT